MNYTVKAKGILLRKVMLICKEEDIMEMSLSFLHNIEFMSDLGTLDNRVFGCNGNKSFPLNSILSRNDLKNVDLSYQYTPNTISTSTLN